MVWLAYLLGGFPSAQLVGSRVGHDPRQEGERNPGAVNVARLAGPGAGAAVYLLDAGKGVLAVRLLSPDRWGWRCAAGLAALIGHGWPLQTGLQGGGRCVAVWTGVATAWAPRAAAGSWATWLLLIRPSGFTRATTVALLTYPLTLLLGRRWGRLPGVGAAYLILAARAHAARKRLR
jgi:glycerol-3-phosphate acyltransferase PlsY